MFWLLFSLWLRLNEVKPRWVICGQISSVELRVRPIQLTVFSVMEA